MEATPEQMRRRAPVLTVLWTQVYVPYRKSRHVKQLKVRMEIIAYIVDKVLDGSISKVTARKATLEHCKFAEGEPADLGILVAIGKMALRDAVKEI